MGLDDVAIWRFARLTRMAWPSPFSAVVNMPGATGTTVIVNGTAMPGCSSPLVTAISTITVPLGTSTGSCAFITPAAGTTSLIGAWASGNCDPEDHWNTTTTPPKVIGSGTPDALDCVGPMPVAKMETKEP